MVRRTKSETATAAITCRGSAEYDIEDRKTEMARIADEAEVENIEPSVSSEKGANVNRRTELLAGDNATTKDELLDRAKAAIEAGEQSLQQAAEALALARDDFNASQREIAAAVGKSVAWVNRLLRWRDEGCSGTPFGPGSKASRERRKRVQAPEQQTRRTPDTDDAEASDQRDDDETAATPNPAMAISNELADFIGAVDTLFVKLSWDEQCKAFAYIKKIMKAPVGVNGEMHTRTAILTN